MRNGAGEVGVDHVLPGVVVDLRREGVGAHARVVHEHEHRAEGLLELREQRFGGVWIRDVGRAAAARVPPALSISLHHGRGAPASSER